MQRLQPRVPSNSSCRWLRKHLELSLLAAQSPFKPLIQVRCATHGAQGRANGPKNSPGRRLGAKKTGDEYVVTGNIIFRQRGTHWFPGENVGMGRDHTIFALQSGYVRYYRDPHKHPKRQYIGVVFDRAHRLPTPQNAARRRRLGMVVVPRAPAADTAKRALGAGTEGGADAEPAAALTKRQAREVKRKKMTGRLPVSELEIRSDYSYRESNWQIGRAAERAGVKVKLFKKGDRFLAWRKKTARIARNAEKRAMGRAKNSKPKAAKTNTRPATPKVQ